MILWTDHHHARFVEGCHWCHVERDDAQPPIADTPWVYGPKERMWFDDDGVLHHARPGRMASLIELAEHLTRNG